MWPAVIWLVLLVVPFFVFIVLPQRRQMQAMAAMQSRLVAGDDVITTSGIYGRVARLDDTVVELEVAPGTVIKVARRAVGQRVADAPPPEPEPEP